MTGNTFQRSHYFLILASILYTLGGKLRIEWNEMKWLLYLLFVICYWDGLDHFICCWWPCEKKNFFSKTNKRISEYIIYEWIFVSLFSKFSVEKWKLLELELVRFRTIHGRNGIFRTRKKSIQTHIKITWLSRFPLFSHCSGPNGQYMNSKHNHKLMSSWALDSWF